MSTKKLGRAHKGEVAILSLNQNLIELEKMQELKAGYIGSEADFVNH